MTDGCRTQMEGGNRKSSLQQSISYWLWRKKQLCFCNTHKILFELETFRITQQLLPFRQSTVPLSLFFSFYFSLMTTSSKCHRHHFFIHQTKIQMCKHFMISMTFQVALKVLFNSIVMLFGLFQLYKCTKVIQWDLKCPEVVSFLSMEEEIQ